MRVRIPRICRIASVLCLGISLAACATGARTGAMTPALAPNALISEASPLRNAVQVGSVTGGSETNPLWKSKVSDDSFRTALDQALQLHTMAAGERPRFILNAELISLDQPFAGFDMTVTAKVRYLLLAQDTQKVLMEEVVETPYTAKLSDAFLGMERLRIANEGAMRENITAIMQKLAAAAKSSPLLTS
jgi:hypothetical protein